MQHCFTALLMACHTALQRSARALHMIFTESKVRTFCPMSWFNLRAFTTENQRSIPQLELSTTTWKTTFLESIMNHEHWGKGWNSCSSDIPAPCSILRENQNMCKPILSFQAPNCSWRCVPAWKPNPQFLIFSCWSSLWPRTKSSHICKHLLLGQVYWSVYPAFLFSLWWLLASVCSATPALLFGLPPPLASA